MVTLGMTSKCVWVLQARLHRRFRTVVTALPHVSMESRGLSGTGCESSACGEGSKK